MNKNTKNLLIIAAILLVAFLLYRNLSKKPKEIKGQQSTIMSLIPPTPVLPKPVPIPPRPKPVI